jgi:hypothetical protein
MVVDDVPLGPDHPTLVGHGKTERGRVFLDISNVSPALAAVRGRQDQVVAIGCCQQESGAGERLAGGVPGRGADGLFDVDTARGAAGQTLRGLARLVRRMFVRAVEAGKTGS